MSDSPDTWPLAEQANYWKEMYAEELRHKRGVRSVLWLVSGGIASGVASVWLGPGVGLGWAIGYAVRFFMENVLEGKPPWKNRA